MVDLLQAPVYAMDVLELGLSVLGYKIWNHFDLAIGFGKGSIQRGSGWEISNKTEPNQTGVFRQLK